MVLWEGIVYFEYRTSETNELVEFDWENENGWRLIEMGILGNFWSGFLNKSKKIDLVKFWSDLAFEKDFG